MGVAVTQEWSYTSYGVETSTSVFPAGSKLRVQKHFHFGVSFGSNTVFHPLYRGDVSLYYFCYYYYYFRWPGSSMD